VSKNGYPLVNYHRYGKSPFSIGKSTINMAIFNSYVATLNYQRAVYPPSGYFNRENEDKA
jgi:hypothetical protein